MLCFHLDEYYCDQNLIHYFDNNTYKQYSVAIY